MSKQLQLCKQNTTYQTTSADDSQNGKSACARRLRKQITTLIYMAERCRIIHSYLFQKQQTIIAWMCIYKFVIIASFCRSDCRKWLTKKNTQTWKLSPSAKFQLRLSLSVCCEFSVSLTTLRVHLMRRTSYMLFWERDKIVGFFEYSQKNTFRLPDFIVCFDFWSIPCDFDVREHADLIFSTRLQKIIVTAPVWEILGRSGVKEYFPLTSSLTTLFT